MEIWKPILGLDEGYEISDMGRVRTTLMRKGSHAAIRDGILKGGIQTLHGGRYQRHNFILRRNGKSICCKAHRLVLEAFVGPCPPGMITLHKNGNALDNRLANLQWGTYKENIRDSIRHGTQKKPPTSWGPAHHNATLTTEQVREIRAHKFVYGDQKRLADIYGVAPGTIRRIIRGESRSSE